MKEEKILSDYFLRTKSKAQRCRNIKLEVETLNFEGNNRGNQRNHRRNRSFKRRDNSIANNSTANASTANNSSVTFNSRNVSFSPNNRNSSHTSRGILRQSNNSNYRSQHLFIKSFLLIKCS